MYYTLIFQIAYIFSSLIRTDSAQEDIRQEKYKKEKKKKRKEERKKGIEKKSPRGSMTDWVN